MDNKKFGKYLSKLRKDRGMTQADLANKLSVTYQAVSRWENGNNLPDINTIEEIASIFNVDINELIKSEDMNNSNKKDKKFIFLIPLVIVVLLICLIVKSNSKVPRRFIEAIDNIYNDNLNYSIEDYYRNNVTNEFKEQYKEYYLNGDYEFIYNCSIGKYIIVIKLSN